MFCSLLILVKSNLFNTFAFNFSQLSWCATTMLTLILSLNQVIVICCKKDQLSFFLSGKFSETGAGDEKGQTGIGYWHKILMLAGLYFEQITQPNNYYN